MAIKAAIFDVDGVIVDTVPLHFHAWKKMFEEYGHPFTMKDYLAHVDGKPRDEGAGSILTELSPDEVKKAGAIKQSYYLQLLDTAPLKVFDSTIKILNEMKKRNIKLAAASSSKNAKLILKKIAVLKLFDVNVSGGDFKKGKPDPEIFLTAASRLQVKPEESVVFEDAKSGVEAAVRGGFVCVGIDRHNNPLPLQGSNIIVKDLQELTLDEILSLERKPLNVSKV